MKKKLQSLISLVLSFILIVAIINFITAFDSSTSKVVTTNKNNIIPTEVKLSNNKIKELQEYYNNTDIKGILTIENLDNFSYPITQTSNNDYYLNHNYYKDYDAYGAIYADYRVNLDNSNKILIFGHSSSKKAVPVPFNELENYYDESYYQEHKFITLETETNTYRYEIFSVYVETSDFTYMNMNFDNDESWYSHLLKLQSKSLYQIDIDLTKEEDILIMQTCSNNPKYQKYSKKYLLIISRRV